MDRRTNYTTAVIAAVLAFGLIFSTSKLVHYAFAAGPPLSTAVSISDPSNNGNQAAVDSLGTLRFFAVGAGGGPGIGSNTPSFDGGAVGNGSMNALSYNYVFNGITWDRLRGTANAGMSVAPYGVNQTPIAATSGVVSNANAVATLPGTAGKTTYISGYRCTNNGATTPTVVNLTVAGILGGTTTTVASVVAAGSLSAIISEAFNPPVPASAANTAIVVTLPAAGAGNTIAECHATGFQL